MLNLSKEVNSVLNTDRYKVNSCSGIIVFLKPNASAIVNFGVVGHVAYYG